MTTIMHNVRIPTITMIITTMHTDGNADDDNNNNNNSSNTMYRSGCMCAFVQGVYHERTGSTSRLNPFKGIPGLYDEDAAA